jgi:hypothetical protein
MGPHDFAHAKSITGNVIYQVVFYNSKDTSAPLAPPSKRQEGQLPLLPPSSGVPAWVWQGCMLLLFHLFVSQKFLPYLVGRVSPWIPVRCQEAIDVGQTDQDYFPQRKSKIILHRNHTI